MIKGQIVSSSTCSCSDNVDKVLNIHHFIKQGCTLLLIVLARDHKLD